MTRSETNRQWRLASYPEGMPQVSDWTLSESAIPEPDPDRMLVRAIYLDVAPYMRARVSPRKNYAAGVAPGEVMIGGGIGVVVRSNASDYREGDIVVTDHGFGWQDYALLRASAVRRVDRSVAPLPYWLDAFGMNGMTAYFALFDAARAQAGDTVVISAAAGSVGQIAGQMAKLAGCRTLGITSSPEKAAWCRESGYAGTIDYRAAGDLKAALAAACPDGVDVFIDNTAGPIHDAVVQNLALNARVVIVGAVSLAGKFGEPDIGPRFHRELLMARATVRGFLVSDYRERHAAARKRVARWYRAGLLRSRFDIVQGLENTPAAFLRLLESRNLGKQLVQVSEEPS